MTASRIRYVLCIAVVIGSWIVMAGVWGFVNP